MVMHGFASFKKPTRVFKVQYGIVDYTD